MTALIVMGWLAATGWLFFRDLEPRLFPSGPPPFSIDLVDEARSQASTRWTVLQYDDTARAEIPRGYVETAIRYNAGDDTFELRSEFKLWEGEGIGVGQGSADKTMRSMYRVTREGALRELQSTFIQKADLNVDPPEFFEADLQGEVRGGMLYGRMSLNLPPSMIREIPESLRGLVAEFKSKNLPPTPVGEGDSVLQPLQPINRIPGLRKGQRWSIPLVTMGRALNNLPGLGGGEEFPWIEAEVQHQTEEIQWNEQAVPCLVIQYHGQYAGEDIRMTQWVRASDGLVLQQEATIPSFAGRTMKMVRD